MASEAENQQLYGLRLHLQRYNKQDGLQLGWPCVPQGAVAISSALLQHSGCASTRV